MNQKPAFVWPLLLTTLTACVAKPAEDYRGNPSRVSSITMNVPEKVKAWIASGKITGYSLTITPESCSSGSTGTKVDKPAQSLTMSSKTLAHESLKSGCSYTLVLSLGALSAAGDRLEKIVLTNDQDGRRTKITAEQTKAAKISVTALLFPTDDSLSEMTPDRTPVPVPSVTESDVEIGVEIEDQPSRSGGSANWFDGLTTVDVPASDWRGQDFGSAFYRDIMSHNQRRLENQSPMTNAHETQHFLNSTVRNQTPEHDNTFYLGNGKAALVREPATKPSVVRNYVPQALQSSSKFKLYIVDQLDGGWKNEMLYIFDEWSGYRADAIVVNEIIRSGNHSALNNEVCITDGASEFLIFATSAVVALSESEPEYLKYNQFKAMYGTFAQDSVREIKAGAGNRVTDCNASKNLEYFKASPDMKRHRDVIRAWMGAQWTSATLGF